MIRRTHLAGASILALAVAGVAPLSLTGGDTPAAAHSARRAPQLFGAAAGAVARQAPDTSLGAVKRSRYVSFHGDLLPGKAGHQQLGLSFFPDADFTGTVEHVDSQKLFTSWSGPLDTQYGSFVATRTGTIYSVTASTLYGSYTMTRTATGAYQVAEVQPPTITGHEDGGHDTLSPTTGGAGSRTAVTSATVDRKKKKKKVRGGDDGSVEDILVVYTAGAIAAYGGADGINAEAAKNIAYTNAAYAASGVGTTARLVGVLPVSGTEAGGGLDPDLEALKKKGDGTFDEVFKYIKATHADDTIMLEKPYEPGAPYCGLGYLYPNQPAKYAFAVVPTGECTNGYWSFPHELGHNQGATHDPYETNVLGNGGKPEYPYGYGYVDPSYAFRTIMSYNDECADRGNNPYCPYLLNFSNPDVVYGGLPEGTSNESDVAKVITKTRKVVARHQQSQLYARGKKVAIKPAPRVGQRVQVTFKGWVNHGVHTKFQWYRNGKPIKHAKKSTYRPIRKDAGKQLSVVVKGKKKYYTTALIGTNSRKVKGSRKKHRRQAATTAAPAAFTSVFVVPNARGSVLL